MIFFLNRSELSVEFRFGLHFANQKHEISEKWIFNNLSENPGGGAKIAKNVSICIVTDK